MLAARTVVVPSGLLLNDVGTTPEAAIENDEADVVEEIGKAMGLTYQEEEPLRVGAKEEERDEHRWELDPASSDDYVERCAAAGAEAVPPGQIATGRLRGPRFLRTARSGGGPA